MRRNIQRQKLTAIGRQATALLRTHPVAQTLVALDVSRSYLYRALDAYRAAVLAGEDAPSLTDPEPNPSTHWLLM